MIGEKSIVVENEISRIEAMMGWLAAFLLFLLMKPYFVWFFVELENWYAIMPLYIIMLINIKCEGYDKVYYVMFAFLAFIAGLCDGANIVGLAFAPLLVSLFIASKRFLFFVFKRLWIIYSSFMALSLLTYILLLIGVNVPGVFMPPLNELKEEFYVAYPFLVVMNDDITYNFCAFLDEPGAVGTMSFFFLFIEKCDFKKVGNWIILVSGILSMSLFFYGALAIYLIYLATLKSLKINRVLILLLIVFGGVLVVTNETVNEKIMQRLSVEDKSDDRLFAGDDRASSELKEYVSSVRWSNEYFFGTNSQSVREMAQGSASIQNVIVRWGLVVLLLYLLFYMFYGIHYIKQRSGVMVFMAFLLLTLYNRPYIFNQVFVFFFNMALFSCSAKMRKLLEWQKIGR